jgi:hypothetical protein
LRLAFIAVAVVLFAMSIVKALSPSVVLIGVDWTLGVVGNATACGKLDGRFASRAKLSFITLLFAVDAVVETFRCVLTVGLAARTSGGFLVIAVSAH